MELSPLQNYIEYLMAALMTGVFILLVMIIVMFAGKFFHGF